MKRSTKIALLLAAAMILLGLILSYAALVFTGGIPMPNGEAATHQITEDFSHITIELDTTDVQFLRSPDDTCKVVFTETDKYRHRAEVQNDTLFIGFNDRRQWFDHISIFGTPSMKAEVYLPRDRYLSLTVETDTGDMEIPGGFLFSFAELETDTGDIFWQADLSGKLSVDTDTGKISLSDMSAAMVELDTDTGDVSLSNVVTLKEIAIETDTGDVVFDRVDGESIFVETNTGDVSGTVLTDKLFRAESDTGHVRIPWDTVGGKCTVITDTGDVDLSVAE